MKFLTLITFLTLYRTVKLDTYTETKKVLSKILMACMEIVIQFKPGRTELIIHFTILGRPHMCMPEHAHSCSGMHMLLI